MPARPLPTLPTLLPLFCLALPLAAIAGAQHDHGPAPQHDFDRPARVHASAHEHGRAELSLVLAERELLLELTAPADSITGFEHAPRSGAHERRLAAALAALRQDTLVRANSEALCRPLGTEAESPFGKAAARDKLGLEHRDFIALWRHECRGKLREINADNLFRSFPRLRTLTVNFVLPDGQGSVTLVPAKPRAELRPR